jgi:hypothetical protein
VLRRAHGTLQVAALRAQLAEGAQQAQAAQLAQQAQAGQEAELRERLRVRSCGRLGAQQQARPPGSHAKGTWLGSKG